MKKTRVEFSSSQTPHLHQPPHKNSTQKRKENKQNQIGIEDGDAGTINREGVDGRVADGDDGDAVGTHLHLSSPLRRHRSSGSQDLRPPAVAIASLQVSLRLLGVGSLQDFSIYTTIRNL